MAIFGNAKPVDTYTREREIEERLLKDQKQLEQQLQEEREREKERRTREERGSRSEREGSHERGSDRDSRKSMWVKPEQRHQRTNASLGLSFSSLQRPREH